MTDDLLIRPALASDVEAIGRIADAVELFPSAMLDDMIAGCLDGSKADVWLVAVADDAPAGFAFCEPERMTVGAWTLLAIGVLPERQSRGIGAALVKALEDRLRTVGHRVLLVETIGSPEFARTRAFYLREGFVEEATIRSFYDEGADKVVFWKHL